MAEPRDNGKRPSLPSPLVPADVDLRGYDFMPFYGNHLLGSEFHAKASDAAWRAGVTLWWAAWNQVPASSLPDDDVALARLADLGRDVKTWHELRHDALHGFIKCSDGRFYHRFLAPLAMEAWGRRQEYQRRTLKARIAALEKRLKEAVTDEDRVHLQGLLQAMKQGQSQTTNQSVTDSRNCQLQGPTGRGTGTGTGEGQDKEQEQVAPRSEQRDADPTGNGAVFLSIPLVAKQGEFDVTETMVTEWEEAYPGIDVRQQLRNLRQWNVANPRRRKTSRGILGHITTWLAKEQDKRPNTAGTRDRAGAEPDAAHHTGASRDVVTNI